MDQKFGGFSDHDERMKSYPMERCEAVCKKPLGLTRFSIHKKKGSR
jgi:hypothetical protein